MKDEETTDAPSTVPAAPVASVTAGGTCTCRHGKKRYDSELARLSTWLFVGVLALMTFMLNAGLQHPQNYFTYTLYVSIIALPLSLIAYMVGHLVPEKACSHTAGSDTKTSGTDVRKIVRWTQQLFVIVSILAVTGLALSTANIFFSTPKNPQPAAAPAQGQ